VKAKAALRKAVRNVGKSINNCDSTRDIDDASLRTQDRCGSRKILCAGENIGVGFGVRDVSGMPEMHARLAGTFRSVAGTWRGVNVSDFLNIYDDNGQMQMR